MVYINELKAHNRGTARILELTENWNSRLELIEDQYDGLLIHGGSQFAVNNTVLSRALSLQAWHHLVIQITENSYTVEIDGFTAANGLANEFSNWGTGSGAVLRFGDIDGWIDEVIVRNVGGAVVANEPPEVTLSAGPGGTNLLSPATLNLTASASDNDGTIDRVELYQGGVKVGDTSTAPYTFSIEGLGLGLHTFTARAIDNNEAATSSAPFTLNVAGVATVAAAPTITPHGGIFDSTASVSIQTTTTGAAIHYTTDGTEPDISSPLYTQAVAVNSNTLLKARSFKIGLAESTTDSANFLVGTSNAVARATFIQTDSVTHGAWKGVYGQEGSAVINDIVSLPDYADIFAGSKEDYEWSNYTQDIRALQHTVTPGGIAACWLSSTNFTVDCRMVDTANHAVALYFADWDNAGRTEIVQVIDAATGLILDTQTISDFANGKYLVWNIRGSVRFRFTRQLGPNALVMGIFFGPGNVIPEGTLKPLRVLNGKFQLLLTGSGGSTYAIQSSADFKKWTPVTTVTLTNSTAIVEAPLSAGDSSQIFRALAVP
jgi:hypothetical protein